MRSAGTIPGTALPSDYLPPQSDFGSPYGGAAERSEAERGYHTLQYMSSNGMAFHPLSGRHRPAPNFALGRSVIYGLKRRPVTILRLWLPPRGSWRKSLIFV